MTPTGHASRRDHLVTLLACVVVAAAGVGLSIHQFPEVASDAEASQIQYSYELGRGELRQSSDAFSPVISAELDQRSHPPVPAPQDPRYEPPLYHAITGVVARAVTGLTPVESYISAARSVGILWLTAGLFLSWLLLVELGVRTFAARVAVVALGLIPVVVDVSATVGNHAAALFAGAAVTVAALRHVRGRASFRVLLLAAVVAALLDPSFVCSALLASMLLVVRAIRQQGDERARRSAIGVAVAVPLLFVVVVAGWNTTSPGAMPSNDRVGAPDASETSDTPASGDGGDGTRGGGLLRDATAMIPVTETEDPVPQAGSALVEPWLDLTNLMVAGSPFCLWLVASRDEDVTRFAGVVACSLVLGALGVLAMNELRAGTTTTAVQPTDGLALLPASIACSAVLVDRTRIGRIGAALAVAVGGTLLIGVVGGLW